MTRRAAESEKRTHAYNGDHTLERGGGGGFDGRMRTKNATTRDAVHAACSMHYSVRVRASRNRLANVCARVHHEMQTTKT